MKWTRGTSRANVEDRRGTRSTGMKLGGGGLVVILLVLGAKYFLGVDIDPRQATGGGQTTEGPPPPEQAELADFVTFVLNDTQTVWRGVLGDRYREAKLVLFSGATDSGCGHADSGIGPFYCPADEKVYIDLTFYEMLRQRFGAPGDFAQAYVMAHEVGHHVQHVLGTEQRVRAQQRSEPGRENELSILMELQADCYAGMWANASKRRDLLEPGDAEEAMAAAEAIGDDRLQQQSSGRVNRESWTHGSSAQRMQWFQRGYQAGSIEACDTFAR